MDKIRKNAVLMGLFFFILSTSSYFYDSGSESESVKNAVQPFARQIFGGSVDDVISGIAAILFIFVTLIFYLMAWKNSKKTLAMFLAMYFLELVTSIFPWELVVSLRAVSFFDSVSCLADGVILCCLLLSKYEVKK